MASSADYLPVNGRFRVIETRLPRQADVQRVLASGASLDDVKALLQGSVLELSADASGSVVSQFDLSYAAAFELLLNAVETSAPKSAVTQWIRTTSQWVRIRSLAKQLIEDGSESMDALELLRHDRSEGVRDLFDRIVSIVSSVRADVASTASDDERERAWKQARMIDIVADKAMSLELQDAVKADRAGDIRIVLRAMHRLLEIRVAVRLSFMDDALRPSIEDDASWFEDDKLMFIVRASDDGSRRDAVMAALGRTMTPTQSDLLLNSLSDAISFEHAVLAVEHALLKGQSFGMEGALPVLAFFKSLERTALMVRVALMTASFGLDAEFMSKRLESIGMNA